MAEELQKHKNRLAIAAGVLVFVGGFIGLEVSGASVLRGIKVVQLVRAQMPVVILRKPVSKYAAVSQASGGGGGSGQILFAADFSNANTSTYNFTTRYANNTNSGNADGQQNGSYTHLPTGGRFGGPASRITWFAGRYQYNLGYTLPTLSHTWALGDKKYLRLRVRVDDNCRFNTPNAIKFWDDRGNDGGGSRSILYFASPYDVQGGGGRLGWPANVEATGYSDTGVQNARVLPPWWGLSGNAASWLSTYNGLYGSFDIGDGIGFKRCDPCLISYGNKTGVPANPNSTSQSSTNGWLELQVEQTWAADNSAPYFKMWLNNNDYANPSSIIRVFNNGVESPGLDGTGWNAAAQVPAYMDGGSSTINDNTFYIDFENIEIGTAFDASWFRG